jgi:plastocyanin domain-containing protein
MNARAFSRFSAGFLVATVALAGCDKAGKGDAAAATGAAASAEPVAPGARRIEITATNEGYSPASVDVKKGETVVLRFKRTTKSECLAEVKIPKLDVKKALPMNEPVEIAVTPKEDGDIPFSCGMDMVHGKIHVTGS